MFEMQALIRQLDNGEKQRIALDSLQELAEKVYSIPARVGAQLFRVINQSHYCYV